MNVSKECRIMSNFKENLLDVLNIRKIDIKTFCKMAGLSQNYIYELDQNTPTLPYAIKIANTLQISIDFLVGRSDKEIENKKRDASLFLNNLKSILKQQNISVRRFCSHLNFSTSCFTRWKLGSYPFLRTVVEISDYLDCSIDDLLI